jgi:integrase
MKRRAKGEGSIWKSEKEGLWVASITIDGKLKRKRSKTQRIVREWLDQQREQIRQGKIVESGQMTFSQLIDKYLEVLGTHLRPKTLESYSNLIRLHIRPELGRVKLKQLSTLHIQELCHRKEKELSPRSVEYIHAIIRRILNAAVKWGLTVNNVALGVELPKKVKKPVEPLTVAQAKRFVEVLEGDRLKALWLLAIGCGLRRSELLGLHKEDVSLETGMIEVKYSLVEVKGKGLILGEPKSEASKRVLALPDFALEALRGHLEQDQRVSEYVFHTSTGKPISPRNASKYFKLVLKRAGLPGTIRLHDLRHTTISWLLAKGVPMKDVQMIAGHSQFSTTADIYGHMLPGAKEAAARKLDGVL